MTAKKPKHPKFAIKLFHLALETAGHTAGYMQNPLFKYLAIIHIGTPCLAFISPLDNPFRCSFNTAARLGYLRFQEAPIILLLSLVGKTFFPHSDRFVLGTFVAYEALILLNTGQDISILRWPAAVLHLAINLVNFANNPKK